MDKIINFGRDMIQSDCFPQENTLLSHYVSLISTLDTYGHKSTVNKVTFGIITRIMGVSLPIIAAISAVQAAASFALKCGLKVIGDKDHNVLQQGMLTLKSIAAIFIATVVIPSGVVDSSIYERKEIVKNPFHALTQFLSNLDPKVILFPRTQEITFEANKCLITLKKEDPVIRSLTTEIKRDKSVIYRRCGAYGITLSSATLTNEELIRFLPDLMVSLPYLDYISFDRCPCLTFEGITDAFEAAKKTCPLSIRALGYRDNTPLDKEHIAWLDYFSRKFPEVVVYDFQGTNYDSHSMQGFEIDRKIIMISRSGTNQFDLFKDNFVKKISGLSEAHTVREYIRVIEEAFIPYEYEEIHQNIFALAGIRPIARVTGLTIQTTSEMQQLAYCIMSRFPSTRIWDFQNSSLTPESLRVLAKHKPKEVIITSEHARTTLEHWKSAIDALLPNLEGFRFVDAKGHPVLFPDEGNVQEEVDQYIEEQRNIMLVQMSPL